MRSRGRCGARGDRHPFRRAYRVTGAFNFSSVLRAAAGGGAVVAEQVQRGAERGARTRSMITADHMKRCADEVADGPGEYDFHGGADGQTRVFPLHTGHTPVSVYLPFTSAMTWPM